MRFLFAAYTIFTLLMETYKQRFIEFMVRSNVLTFGDFTTKSGRRTPFFINTGNYRTGSQIRSLGEFYAAAMVKNLGNRFDVLYGPAYKGIPLVVTAASALAAGYGRDVAYCFNRKEAKDHGEGGIFIGHAPVAPDRILIVEDVVTAGTSVRETVALLGKTPGISLAGLIVSVNRMEKGVGEKGALAELADEFGIAAFAIVTLDEIIAHLHGRTIDGVVVLTDAILAKIAEYRSRYGAAR
jgi:orotate phosphoribosyltransferase